MPEYLQIVADKFTFRVATDRLYSSDGLWLQEAGGRVRIGLSDFVQQHSGDVAFIRVKTVGTRLEEGDDIAELETVKVNMGLPTPVSGAVLEVNKALELTPEVVNQDPYGEGWLAIVEAQNWSADRASLLEPPAYLALMQSQVEQELRA